MFEANMDEEWTAGYREPCVQCSAVDWGVSDEGRFYCRSCHNVIERTREVVDPTFTPGSSRVSTIGKGSRTKKTERGHQWNICEGFQFILKKQAEALIRLGVSPRLKDEVLCELWRLYLQKSGQAFTDRPLTSFRVNVRGLDSDSESAAEFSGRSVSDTDGETVASSTVLSNAGSSVDPPPCSGSSDAVSYLTAQQLRSSSLMTMRKTLALIHIALVWIREALTLSDLLRLVNEGHVPYVNAFEELPDEMKLEGKDHLIFKVETIPSHESVHKEAQALLHVLQLPPFPPISCQSLLHPALLSLRYLTELNLPDELHLWVCRLMEQAGLEDQTVHTVDPLTLYVLPRYGVQTAALIVVTMKAVFGVDDLTEWEFSGQTGNLFNLRRWYKLLQAALIRAQQNKEHDTARKQWRSKRDVSTSRNRKWVAVKKKRTAEQVQICFERLSSRPAGVERIGPSSFRFCWGDEDGADGPGLHHLTLDGVLTLKHGVLTPSHSTYWHPALQQCNYWRCRSHYLKFEPTLPRMFVWLLKLFSFLLDVKPASLYEEVLRVERRVFGSRTPWRKTETKTETKTKTKTKTKCRPKTKTKTRPETETRPETKTKTKTKCRPKTKTKTRPETETRPETKTAKTDR
ncbi:TATA box-binding protein-associated factor RNA polymerase I subunit B isoform X2 [Larimichthys crocea]|uniref:TATA box-binding protein-associated factor RNA polymerase I subunit B isoform X2 n=1 Tax=Larimichthys crocea TaxID=215358 RepID=UPI000F5FBF36|nr:TATA box-binding protein-associated factor RNA polymerase I subunit B isoform X2 [Larimichthys crocea]